jgi:hypothetical protein
MKRAWGCAVANADQLQAHPSRSKGTLGDGSYEPCKDETRGGSTETCWA